MAKKKITLGTESSKKWIMFVAGSTPFLKSIPVVRSNSATGNVRILDAQNYGLKVTSRYNQVSFDYDQGFNVPFSCKEIVLPIVISDSDLEDMGINPAGMENINSGDGKAIAEKLGLLYGLDLQDMILNGDTSLSEVTDPSTPAEYRQNMLRQIDGYIKILDDASRIIKDASLDTIKKEIAKLYETYANDDLITINTKIWLGNADYLSAWKAVTSTAKDLTIKDGKLYYITTELVPVSRFNHILIGDPQALQVRIFRDVNIENQRSLEHRGYKYLLGTRADAIMVKEIFRGLEHTE